MNKEKVFYVTAENTNMVQLIGPNIPFMGDENAARFRATKLNNDEKVEDKYEAISVADYEKKYGVEANEDKSE